MIIGIAGPKGSGKDTVYKIINDIVPCCHVAFADPVREANLKILGLKPEDIDIFKRSKVQMIFENRKVEIDGRHIYREIGMLMRHYDTDQFVNYVLEKIQGAPDKLWIITDVRFENEVKFIREQKGKIILLERDGYNYDNHPSEMGILDFDFKVQNTTIENLKNQIKIILKEIL